MIVSDVSLLVKMYGGKHNDLKLKRSAPKPMDSTLKLKKSHQAYSLRDLASLGYKLFSMLEV